MHKRDHKYTMHKRDHKYTMIKEIINIQCIKEIINKQWPSQNNLLFGFFAKAINHKFIMPQFVEVI